MTTPPPPHPLPPPPRLHRPSRLRALIATAAIPVLLAACAHGEAKELLRVSSPDSLVDAVVIWNYGGGAAGWSDLFVYLTAAGDSVAGTPVLWTDGAEPEIRWIAPRLVEVAPKDFVRSFRNFWVSPRGDTVEVRLGTMSARAREVPR